MKRKDVISLVAMLVIVGVALIGEQFMAKGDWLDASINLSLKLIPLVLFFVFAVVARNRKGGHTGLWRKVSYVLFGLALLCLLWMSVPFMHYFNVMNSKKIVSDNVTVILDKCNEMFDDYERQVDARLVAYRANVQSAYDGNSGKMAVLQKEDASATSYRGWPDAWQKNMFENPTKNKEQFLSQRTTFEEALILNFNPFLAASQFEQLVTQYNSYRELLSEHFANQNPFEKNDQAEMDFEPKSIQSVSEKTMDVFTESHFNLGIFLAYLVLVLFSSFSYVFFKDDLITGKFSNKKNYASVYNKGFQLKK